MGSADDLAVVAPGIGKWISVVRLVPVESEPSRFSEKVSADECLKALAVGCALDLVCHGDELSSLENRRVSNLIRALFRAEYAKPFRYNHQSSIFSRGF